MKKMIYYAILIFVLMPQAWAWGITAQTSSAGIEYVIGGVGIDERKAMNEAYSDYSLRVEVAVKTGAYLSNVHVTISGEGGMEYIHVMLDGPILLVNLPAGTYMIEGIYEGQAQKRKVTVKEGRQTRSTLLW